MSSNQKLDIELLVKSFKVVNVEAFNSYLKEVWTDLTQRSEEKKGIDRITFSSYYQVPGILSVRLFSVFNISHTDYIDKDEFIKGMNTLFCESYDKTSKFIFIILLCLQKNLILNFWLNLLKLLMLKHLILI